ncbi:syncoilin [Platichthys flesus]|uniref:syncoilin n=1 Tax=Platichthys flesus TaxID=8260 RepID=UPI002DB990B8|nr:syncoilin [Platichthys flesus]
MEDMDDSVSSAGFEPLFIQEEAGDPDRTLIVQRERSTPQSELPFPGTRLNPSALIRPYLHEMDDLLKSCEDLTGIPFVSRFSEGYTETSLSKSTHCRSEEEVTMESYRETSVSPHAYLSTSYMDTHMDGAEADEQPGQGPLQGMGTIISKRELSPQPEMPLTSAGSKLSNAMVQYEGQLLGMLSMLEGCMEEAGMDFEPQDWATDAGQEYVHISKNPRLHSGTTLVPIQQKMPGKLETQPTQREPRAVKHAEGDSVSEDDSSGMTVGSTTNESRQNHLLCCENMAESLERSRIMDQGFLDPHINSISPSDSSDCNENDPLYCEGTETQYMSHESTEREVGISETEIVDTDMPAEEKRELTMDTIFLSTGRYELGELGSQMEECIQEVQRLEEKRKQLLAEVLELRGNKNREDDAEGSNDEEEVTEEQMDRKVAELMDILKSEEGGRREGRKKEIQSLREVRAEEERRMWKVNLERQELQDELRKLKMRLFAMVRACAHSQASLNNQRREVELLKREEEKLQSLVLQLTEESSHLRSDKQQRLLQLQTQRQAQTSSQNSSAQQELTECRRQSCGDIQQYLQGGLRALENRYEPILLALLKRREATAGALVKAKEQAQELRAQLRPLRDEIQQLKLRRACLEEKLKLICIHRKEDAGRYKETVFFLEESSRELKTEFKIQKKKTKDIEEMRDRLTKQLQLYRAAIEDHECDHEQET